MENQKRTNADGSRTHCSPGTSDFILDLYVKNNFANTRAQKGIHVFLVEVTRVVDDSGHNARE